MFLQLLIRKSVRVVCGWSLVRIPELFVVIYDYSLSRFCSSGLFVRDSHYKQKRKKNFFFLQLETSVILIETSESQWRRKKKWSSKLSHIFQRLSLRTAVTPYVYLDNHCEGYVKYDRPKRPIRRLLESANLYQGDIAASSSRMLCIDWVAAR